MHVLVNTSNLKVGGALQVAYSIIEELAGFPEHSYTIVLSPALSAQVDTLSFPSNFTFFHFPFNFTGSVFSFFRSIRYLRSIEKRVRPDCVFSVFGPAYWAPDAKHLMGFALPQYVFYRESPYLSSLGPGKMILHHLKKSVHKFFIRRNAPLIHVETDQVKVSLAKEFGMDLQNIFVVPNTCNKAYDQVPEIKPVFRLPGKSEDTYRLLVFSSYYPHKNLEILEKVSACLRKMTSDRFEFVFTLPKKTFETIFPAAPGEFINIGPVPVTSGPSLYHQCDALLLPTLLECSSATYPEAMKMGIPVVTSDLSFIKAICSDAALYFDPADPADIAGKIVQLRNSAGLRETLVQNGKKRLSAFPSAKMRVSTFLGILTDN